MTREVTKTTVKVAKIEVENGVPVAVELPSEVLIGNIRMERAQKVLDKKYGHSVTIIELLPETVTYEMAVEDFIAHATIKVDEPTEEESV